MKGLKVFCLFIFIGFGSNLKAQEDAGQNMKSFVPPNKSFDLYYPDGFALSQEDGTYSFIDSVSGLCITVSDMHLKKAYKEKDFIPKMSEMLNQYFEGAVKESDWKNYKSKFDQLIELQLNAKGNHWIWWAVADKNTVLMISFNKGKALTESEINMGRFMIDHLLFYH